MPFCTRPAPCTQGKILALLRLQPILLLLALAIPLALPATSALGQDALTSEAPEALASDPERAVVPTPLRYILVKALGQGGTPEEAEQSALRNARQFAAKRFSSPDGAGVLDPAHEAERIVNVHHFPVLGLSMDRAVVLLELRLRGLPEPPPASLGLPGLTLRQDAGVLILETSKPSEAVIIVDSGKEAALWISPSGGGAASRLSPGKPWRLPLPSVGEATAHALACTGGLSLPVYAPTVAAALAGARVGRPHPSTIQGVVSECVEVRLEILPSKDIRSMRLKGSENPVDMTGAAGRTPEQLVPSDSQ